MANILVCDDDKEIVDAIEIYLSQDGYKIYKAYDGEQAIQILDKEEIHLLIMDIMMPKLDGIRATLKIREYSSIPIIILSAKSEDTDKILGLNIGADDYICKPFSLILLWKRMEALLRTRYKTEKIWKYQETVVDFSAYRATYQGLDAAVTPKEIKLLAVLLENSGQVVSREQILDKIWGEEESPYDRVVDVYVKNLRKKLHLDCIVTVKGVGYKLELS